MLKHDLIDKNKKSNTYFHEKIKAEFFFKKKKRLKSMPLCGENEKIYEWKRQSQMGKKSQLLNDVITIMYTAVSRETNRIEEEYWAWKLMFVLNAYTNVKILNQDKTMFLYKLTCLNQR